MIKLDYLYFGIVESVDDPLMMGRVQARVIGVHTHLLQDIPTADLPWAQMLLPTTEPFLSGIGWSPTGIVPGSMVAMIPIDDMKQEWQVLFTIGGYRTNEDTKAEWGFKDPENLYPLSDRNHDVNFLARGVQVKVGEKTETVFNPNVEKAENATDMVVEEPYDDGKPKEPDVPVTETPWMKFAEAEIGTNEKDDPKKINEFHTYGGGSNRWGGETPWCASFVGWCFYKSKMKGSGSAMARSYLKWGKELPINNSIPYGAVIVIKGDRGASSGHVCFATGVSNGRVQVVGGNQSAKSKQNGGEVTRSSFPLTQVIGVRWPSDAPAKKE